MNTRASSSETRKRIDRRCPHCKNALRLVHATGGGTAHFRKALPTWVCIRCDKWGKLVVHAKS